MNPVLTVVAGVNALAAIACAVRQMAVPAADAADSFAQLSREMASVSDALRKWTDADDARDAALEALIMDELSC